MRFPNLLSSRWDYWGFYGSIRGAAKFDRICRSIIIVAYIILCFGKFAISNQGKDNKYTNDDVDGSTNPQDYPVVKISMAICTWTSYIYMYYFLMGFNATGPFVLTMARIISGNIPYFLKFYSITLVAYAMAIAVLTNNGDPSIEYGFGHVLFICWNLIKQTVSLQNFQEWDSFGYEDAAADYAWLLDICVTTFYICVVLVMLNLLIAMVNGK